MFHIFIYIFCRNGSGDEGTSEGTDATRGATRAATRGVTRDRRQATDQGTSNVQMEVQSAFDKMLTVHPVDLDAVVPIKTEREKFSPAHARQLYERWLKAQMKLRVNLVRCKFFFIFDDHYQVTVLNTLVQHIKAFLTNKILSS